MILLVFQGEVDIDLLFDLYIEEAQIGPHCGRTIPDAFGI